MEKVMSKFLRSSLVTSIVLLILGILLIFQSEATIFAISYIIGGLLIAIGGVAIVRFIKNMSKASYDLDIIYGTVTIILGVLIIKNPQALASIIPIVFGIGIIVSSVTKLQYSLQIKEKNNDLWKTTAIVSIISLLCGVVLLFNPFEVAVGITRIVGIFILIYSVLDIISTLSLRSNFKNIKDDNKIIDAEIVKEEEKPKKKTKTEKTSKKKNDK